MGYFLIYERMIDSIIYARNKFLKPNGLMLPSKANMYMAPQCAMNKYTDKFNFWEDCYGFKIPVKKEINMKVADVNKAYREDLLTKKACLFKSFDMNTVEINDLDFTSKYELKIDKISSY
jgi:hypothetical protein